MSNYHCQQPIKTGQIVSFPKLKANCSEVRFTKSPKTWAPEKKKKKKAKEGNIFLLKQVQASAAASPDSGAFSGASISAADD